MKKNLPSRSEKSNIVTSQITLKLRLSIEFFKQMKLELLVTFTEISLNRFLVPFPQNEITCLIVRGNMSTEMVGRWETAKLRRRIAERRDENCGYVAPSIMDIFVFILNQCLYYQSCWLIQFCSVCCLCLLTLDIVVTHFSRQFPLFFKC